MSKNDVGELIVIQHIDGSFAGEVVAYYSQPTYVIRSGNGEHTQSWPVDLCHRATPEEEVEYWKKRALNAESPTTGGE